MISNGSEFLEPAQILFLAGLGGTLRGLLLSFLAVVYDLEEAELQGVAEVIPGGFMISRIFTTSLTPQIGICFPQLAPLTDNSQIFGCIGVINNV